MTFQSIIDSVIINKELDSSTKILEYLFNNQEIKSQYLNEIRRATVIWQTANEIFAQKWFTDKIDIKAIWDIDYPENLKQIRKVLCKESLDQINTENLIWYDINSQWTTSLRKKIYNLMWNSYNFEQIPFEKIDQNIFFCYWWSDWFSTIIDSLNHIYKNIKFIYPEASFPANVEIAKFKIWEQNVIKLTKPENNNYFIDLQQVQNLDSNNTNVFYITPVWNPTWELLDKNILVNIIKEICSNKNNLIILDNVYVSLLKQSISKDLFNEIFANQELRNRLIICESMSKTLWTTGIRIAWCWGFNKELMLEIRKINSLHKAWFSKILVEFLDNLLVNQKQIIEFQKQTFQYWSEKKLEFYNNLKNNFSHLFEFENSAQVREREWIYLFLKIKENIDPISVFIETKVIWVAITLSDGKYIRYAFWNAK